MMLAVVNSMIDKADTEIANCRLEIGRQQRLFDKSRKAKHQRNLHTANERLRSALDFRRRLDNKKKELEVLSGTADVQSSASP